MSAGVTPAFPGHAPATPGIVARRRARVRPQDSGEGAPLTGPRGAAGS